MIVSILHHHLEPGGVTQVVDLAVQALCSHLQDLEEVRLITGRSGGAELLLNRLEKVCQPKGVNIKLVVIEEIDYLSADSVPGKEADNLKRHIKHLLLRACSGSIWMVHNYHIGKNPLFTLALLEIAREHHDERICFYIHDFPECARYENLAFLRRFVSESTYPVATNVRYAVINGRDRQYLADAGVPDSLIFLLNDPVPLERLPDSDTDELRRKLAKRFKDEYPAYLPEAPLLIYPIRTIRRKNVLEMGLICATSPDPVNLVVTLPGTSQTEKGYSQCVSTAFSKGLIPGLWGVGSQLDELGISFPELLSTADVICSSSVQEGFGYLFINSLAWGIPLFARYLDILDGVTDVFTNHPSHFYKAFRIPASPGSAAVVRAAYEEKAKRLRPVAGDGIVESIGTQIDSVVSAESVEFSFLPLEDQLAALKKAKTDKGYGDTIRDLNGEVFGELGRLCAAGRSPEVRSSDWPFSFAKYAATVEAIIASFETPLVAKTHRDVQAVLIRRFAGIEYLRLLYGN